MKKRPSPEELLKKAEEEERQQRSGKLKIFLGAAPGVGKTYAMLEEALAKRKQGLDVVIGIGESHGRRNTMLIEKFEILPRQSVKYQGKEMTEFDLTMRIKRHLALY